MEWGLILLWLVTFQVLSLLGAPIVASLLPRFPDRGAFVALPFALVVITSIAFWIGQFTFGAVALIGGLLGLSALTVIAILYGPKFTIESRPHVEALLLFTLAFGFLLTIRAIDPAVTPQGGEKFLDFGLLKSILRADQLPPEDMWFAGKPVRYYYGGHLITALLSKLTGTPGRYSYNLALAGFYAMFVTTTYGVTRAVADARGVPPRPAGFIAVFFAGFASNLYTPVGFVLRLLPDSLATWAVDFLDVRPAIILTFFPFDVWTPTRVIEDTFNVFPVFAYLHGDLHAYMMSPPFLILVVAILLGYYETPESDRRKRWLLLASTVPVVGLIAIIDTWSVPTVGGLLFLTLIFSPARTVTLLPKRVQVYKNAVRKGETTHPLVRTGSQLIITSAIAMGIILASLFWVLPFVTQTASSREFGFFPERSPLGQFLLVHGAFLLVFAFYLLPRVRPFLTSSEVRRNILLYLLLIGIGVTTNIGALVIVGPLLVIAALLLQERGNVNYETVLFIAGAGLVLLLEFAYIHDRAGVGRINTVFKIYFQVWVIWSLAVGVALSGFTTIPLTRYTSMGDTGLRKKLVPIGVTVLLLSLSLYGGLTLGTFFVTGSMPEPGANDSSNLSVTVTSISETFDKPTLDALAFVEAQHSEEVDAIMWLDKRNGTPTIVSAPGIHMYYWVNAPSSLTGVPTVAGWKHEVGYRGEEAYLGRVNDVNVIYHGDSEIQLRLLTKYDVKYIYVGPEERNRYDIITFDRRPWLTVAYQDDHVTIYEIKDIYP